MTFSKNCCSSRPLIISKLQNEENINPLPDGPGPIGFQRLTAHSKKRAKNLQKLATLGFNFKIIL
jgi:hypothetical protein